MLSQQSLGLEASVDVGCLVADDREHVVGEDSAEALVVGVQCASVVIDSAVQAIVKFVHGMLLEEGDEDGGLGGELAVSDEGADLGAEVSDSA